MWLCDLKLNLVFGMAFTENVKGWKRSSYAAPPFVDRIFQAFRLLRVNRSVAVSALSHRGGDHLAAFRAGEDLRLRLWLSLTEN
jgi:hypothetical protein